MINFLKDLSIFLFTAGEEIEKKAAEFKGQRESRYKEFEEKIKDSKDEFKSKYGEKMENLRKKFSEFSGNLGLATKEELNEIKIMISELTKKMDEMNKK
jgi:hypothetical protein